MARNLRKNFAYSPNQTREGMPRISATIRNLNDKEKFILAKKNQDVDILLELIRSNDPINKNNASFLESRHNSKILKDSNVEFE